VKVRRVIESDEGVVNHERSHLCQDDFSNDNVDIAEIVRRDNDAAYRRSKSDYPSISPSQGTVKGGPTRTKNTQPEESRMSSPSFQQPRRRKQQQKEQYRKDTARNSSRNKEDHPVLKPLSINSGNPPTANAPHLHRVI